MACSRRPKSGLLTPNVRAAYREMTTGKTFRHSAVFGKRIEYWIIGRMLKEGIDVYVPLVDDHAVDAIIKRTDGTTALVHIKARSKDAVDGDGALFAAIPLPGDVTPEPSAREYARKSPAHGKGCWGAWS